MQELFVDGKDERIKVESGLSQRAKREAEKMAEPDFEFGFGNGRYLKGHGWRGLVALGFFLFAAVIAASAVSKPLPSVISRTVEDAQNLVSAR